MSIPYRPVLFLLLASLVAEAVSGPVDGLSAGGRLRVAAHGRGGRVPLRRGLPGRPLEEQVEEQDYHESQVLEQPREQIKPELRALFFKGRESQELLQKSRKLEPLYQSQVLLGAGEQAEPEQRAPYLRTGEPSAHQELLQGNRKEEPLSYNRDALAYGQAAQVPAEFLQESQPQALTDQPTQAPHVFRQQAILGPRQDPLSFQDQFKRSKPTTTTPEPQWSAQRAMYSFSSDQQDKISDLSHSRTETRSEGTVRGSYSYSDGFVQRHVQYIADRDGYRIIGESTSPLSEDGPVVDPSGRAAVQADVDGQGYSYVVRGEDIYRPSFRTRRPTPELV